MRATTFSGQRIYNRIIKATAEINCCRFCYSVSAFSALNHNACFSGDILIGMPMTAKSLFEIYFVHNPVKVACKLHIVKSIICFAVGVGC